MTTWRINRLSREWVGPITVTKDGTPVTGWTLAVLPLYQTPATADVIDEDPTPLDGGLGVLVGPGTGHVLDPGEYTIWVRYVDNPEAPVLSDVGRIVVERGTPR
ncbi:MAG TPA: hypothetical protein VFV67_34140 [Actinophytocola sp.]|uniref:hypothetical protein n=1 Tax=Actinophytocola sp. TaxID=1872138 RepID=UPI002DB78B8F|nr:hypothetical protein [Actinophytocola sp.]HEU5475709.1 hypothetical protein [Actinophytocola sp.]